MAFQDEQCLKERQLSFILIKFSWTRRSGAFLTSTNHSFQHYKRAQARIPSIQVVQSGAGPQKFSRVTFFNSEWNPSPKLIALFSEHHFAAPTTSAETSAPSISWCSPYLQVLGLTVPRVDVGSLVSLTKSIDPFALCFVLLAFKNVDIPYFRFQYHRSPFLHPPTSKPDSRDDNSTLEIYSELLFLSLGSFSNEWVSFENSCITKWGNGRLMPLNSWSKEVPTALREQNFLSSASADGSAL